MIDPLSEEMISLTKAAKLLPSRRGGKSPHVSCLYRWTVAGCRGVVLESIQIGGTRCTSKEALKRFFIALSSTPHVAVAESSPKAKDRDMEIAAAESRCKALDL